jgi:hypothetical protein
MGETVRTKRARMYFEGFFALFLPFYSWQATSALQLILREGSLEGCGHVKVRITTAFRVGKPSPKNMYVPILWLF